MKKLLLAALLITGISTFAQQLPTTGTDTPKKEKITPTERTQKLTTELGLDEKQQVKVKEALVQQEKTNAEFKAQYKTAPDAAARTTVKENIKKENTVFRAKMKEILTADQYRKWELAAKNSHQKTTVKEKVNLNDKQ